MRTIDPTWTSAVLVLALLGCAGRGGVEPATSVARPASSREAGFHVSHYLDDRERDCWVIPNHVSTDPSPEEIARRADPEVPDQMPRVRTAARADTRSAGLAHLSAQVMVDALVDSKGRVVRACLATASDTPLDELAIETTFKMLYEPGRKGGVAVPVWVRIPFEFVGERRGTP